MGVHLDDFDLHGLAIGLMSSDISSNSKVDVKKQKNMDCEAEGRPRSGQSMFFTRRTKSVGCIHSVHQVSSEKVIGGTRRNSM